MSNRLRGILLLVIAGILAAGCASVTQGTTEGSRTVLVTSDPTGATVMHQGLRVGSTPCKIRIDNSNMKFPVELHLDGYEPVKVSVVDGTNASLAGNLLVGGVGGIGLDVLNGAAIRTKGAVHIKFQKPINKQQP